MLACFNFVIFYSLVFIYPQLWILIYSKFATASFSYDSQWQQISLGKVYRALTSGNSFCHQKTKKQTGYAWQFLQPPMQMCESSSIPYLKISIPFFCCPLFFKDFLNLQDQHNGKHIFDEQLSLARFNLKDTSSRIPRISLVFWIFVESSAKSLKLIIPPWLGELVKFLFRSLGNRFASRKIDPQCLYPSQYFSSGSYHHPQAQGNCSFPSRQHFQKFVFPSK